MPASESFTAELAALLPRLPGAIERDNTGLSRSAAVSAGLPVNPDVLHAIILLHREIPLAAMRAAALAGEPWHPRPVKTCLRAIDRFTARLYDLGQPLDALGIEDDVRRWTRVTKLALGLRTPDIPIGALCPVCAGAGLLAAGSEGFVRRNGHAVVVEWEHAGRVYCPAGGESWAMGEWPLLGRLLEAV